MYVTKHIALFQFFGALLANIITSFLIKIYLLLNIHYTYNKVIFWLDRVRNETLTSQAKWCLSFFIWDVGICSFCKEQLQNICVSIESCKKKHTNTEHENKKRKVQMKHQDYSYPVLTCNLEKKL